MLICIESQSMKGEIEWTILRKGIRTTGLAKRVRTKANIEMFAYSELAQEPIPYLEEVDIEQPPKSEMNIYV